MALGAPLSILLVSPRTRILRRTVAEHPQDDPHIIWNPVTVSILNMALPFMVLAVAPVGAVVGGCGGEVLAHRSVIANL